MRDALLVALGGAAGSVLRWLISGWVQSRFPSGAPPWGTLSVNLAGSFAIGLVMTLALERSVVSPATRLLLVTGVLGGFTTFSALSWDALSLARDGRWAAAFGYATGSLVFGLVAALGGVMVARRI